MISRSARKYTLRPASLPMLTRHKKYKSDSVLIQHFYLFCVPKVRTTYPLTTATACCVHRIVMYCFGAIVAKERKERKKNFKNS